MFQHNVNRQFGTGVVGEIVNDGPIRAKPARIVAGAAGTLNKIGRAFGHSADGTMQGATAAALSYDAVVGGAKFFGILAHPKHYALYGATPAEYAGEQAGPLSPTLELPVGNEGEFVDMGIMLVELTQGNLVAGDITYGFGVYYCVAAGAATATDGATTVADIGKLFAFTDASAADADARFNKIDGAIVITSNTGVAAGAAVLAKVQLTR